MARRTNSKIPPAVRNAARASKRDGTVNIGEPPKPDIKAAVKQSAVPMGQRQLTAAARAQVRQNHIPNTGTRQVKWLYQPGDLVKFRDYRGQVVIGTIIGLHAYHASVMTGAGVSQIPCPSLQLCDRLEEAEAEEATVSE
jgi:hypothetical protein